MKKYFDHAAIKVVTCILCILFLCTVVYAGNYGENGTGRGEPSHGTPADPPVISCPAPIIQNTDDFVCKAVVSYTVTNNGGAADFMYAFTGATTDNGNGTGSGETFNKGVTEVTVTATNNEGSSSCTFTITIVDQEGPNFNCSPQTYSCASQVPTPESQIPGMEATDNCPGMVAITFVSDSPPSGNYPCNYTITRTFRATDVAGNFTDCQQTITVHDVTPPAFNEETLPGDMNLSCGDDVPDAPTITADDNCTENVVVGYEEEITPGNCPNKFVIVRTWTASDDCGNSISHTQTITVQDTEAPVFSENPDPVTYQCLSEVPAPGKLTAVDNCDGEIEVTGVDEIIEEDPCNMEIWRTWTFTDACSNSSSVTQVITVRDNTPPVIICPEDQSKTIGQGQTHYTAVLTEFDPSSVGDNCTSEQDIMITNDFNNSTTLAGAQFPVGTTTVTWKATDECGNSSSCSFDVTVDDCQSPAVSYIILATNEAKFGETNLIHGDVGVSASNGKAEFKKYCDLFTHSVTAKHITVHLPSNIMNRNYSPATGPYWAKPPFVIYNGNTAGLGNYTATMSTPIPITNNYKHLTIKKNVMVTVAGNNYGKITIEEGAKVTFTSTSINMEELVVGKGKKGMGTTNIYFTGSTEVKVKDKVTVEENTRVNVNGPKVTFYMGDNKKDEEKFKVKGDDVEIKLNIMIPNGKMKIEKKTEACTMTGWFIIEKLESTGSVTWNRVECEAALSSFGESIVKAGEEPAATVVATTPVVTLVETEKAMPFNVRVYPNPSAVNFSIMVNSTSLEPVTIRVMDMLGNIVSVITQVTKGSVVNLGSDLKSGTYMAEVIQGTNRQLVKLVKIK